jgi:sensor histidine kinase regulating citrate/malate metabolism
MITVFYSGVNLAGHIVLRMVMTLFFIFMVLGNMVLFYAFQKHTEDISEAARQEVELIHKNAEIERLTKIAEMNDDYREVVHNMTHSLKAIEKLAMEHDVENVREIVEDLTGRLVQREIYEYSNHRMINTILSEYESKAEQKKIKFDVYVEPGCIIKQVKDIDLVSMLGNVLDNAFEAAGKVEDSSVVFRMFMHEKGKMCIIKAVNDYEEDIIEKNGVVQTTKKEKGIHGIGLKSIAKTAEKYKGSFSYYTEDKKFYAVLLLPIE